MTRAITVWLFLLLGAAAARAQSTTAPKPMAHDPAMPMDMPMPAGPDTPSTKAYRAAMARMGAGMTVPYTGDADRDFVAGMIPHHQGAIDMASAVLQYGKDPELKKLAREIIAAQDKEIAFMKRWLAAHPAP